ncbi:cupin-like domain-containing protein [Congregibacter brevis]|uniref:Cupin-like domain-containing protein n=1 Tax=Congregibacter brevis TaxID=3081201 RepID=A0ABZ0IG83_9GAMM|nr:cupin-like domain-containing protein [Congregibacter sp. IMCC45268]
MIFDKLAAIESTEGVTPDAISSAVLERTQPLILRGLVSSWPAVQPAEASFEELGSYLSKFWNDRPVTAYVAAPETKGRFGYNEAFNGFNFKKGSAPLEGLMERFKELNKPGGDADMSVYVGSTPVEGWLPGFLEANSLAIPGDPLINFWLGNRTTVAAHYDFPCNLACVVAGRRRFTLFPTDQVSNLYVGPIDRTPSGQPISLVDFDEPDFQRFPRFAIALENAQTAVLEPGDAIFIPSMWWHHVKALSVCNMLVNYWWLKRPEIVDSPFGALLHAVLSIRSLPPEQREAWRTLMEHYVFDAGQDSVSHIPEHVRGCLGELDAQTIEQLRKEVADRLNS